MFFIIKNYFSIQFFLALYFSQSIKERRKKKYLSMLFHFYPSSPPFSCTFFFPLSPPLIRRPLITTDGTAVNPDKFPFVYIYTNVYI